MSAFKTIEISPLDLYLDAKNPRFIVSSENPSNNEIMTYLCRNEDVVKLCSGLNEIGTILPGERIVVCKEDNKYIVLEGNRRVCCCKMLLDPSQIPTDFISKIGIIKPETRRNIEKISVDVVSNRKSALKYLAARHISGVRDWSTIAKMNFVTEEFSKGKGKTIQQISEASSLPVATIKKYLKSSNLLDFGISSGTWNENEKLLLVKSNLKPDRYLRLFSIQNAKQTLQLTYDEYFVPHSERFSDKTLYSILAQLIKGAFITKSLDTRISDFFDPRITELIGHFLNESDILEMNHENTSCDSKNSSTPAPSKTSDHPSSSSNTIDQTSSDVSSEPNIASTVSSISTQSKHFKKVPPPKNLPLFATLDGSFIDATTYENRGVIAIISEIVKFSQNPKNPIEYPIAAVMLTRSLIEHVLIYYLRKKGLFDKLLKQNNNDPQKLKLQAIVDFAIKNASNLFSTPATRHRFCDLFETYRSPSNPLNWVVHQLGAYQMSTQALQTKVDEGLLDLIQTMIK